MPRRYRPDPHASLFGDIIRRLREQRGWTATQLARRAGMNPTYLCFLERGCNIPTLRTVITLSDVLQTNAADVIREVLERRNPPPAAAPTPARTLEAVRAFARTRNHRRRRA